MSSSVIANKGLRKRIADGRSGKESLRLAMQRSPPCLPAWRSEEDLQAGNKATHPLGQERATENHRDARLSHS